MERSQFNKDIEISKLLSYILRHGALKEKLIIDAEGYIDVEIILRHKSFVTKGCSFSDIQRIVSNNNKNRFMLKCVNQNQWKIKANQGHSLVNVNKLDLKEISTGDYEIIVHGSYYRFLDKIKSEGLKCMNRNHIHFTSKDKIDFSSNKEEKVSGFRESSQILIYIDFKRAISDGIKFFKSENNVILSAGVNGCIAPKYFQKIVDRKTGKLI